jgi:SAM-dependent methyltransferase
MTDSKTIDYYNESADTYLNVVSRDKPDADLNAFINAIPINGTVLDLGCGPGNSAAFMQAAGLTAHAMDASTEMVKIAREKFNIDAKVARFDDLTAVGTYDGIWANFSLLHAPRTDMPANLTRIHTALKPNGLLHIGLKIGTGEKRDTLGRNYTFYELDELKSLLIDAGFKLHSERIDADGTKSMTGALDPFMIVTAYA